MTDGVSGISGEEGIHACSEPGEAEEGNKAWEDGSLGEKEMGD